MSEELTNKQLDQIMLTLDVQNDLLRDILAALKSSARQVTGQVSNAAPKIGDEPIPQPKEIIPDAGDVQVHFGKNKGVALNSLSERSLSWYATEQPPRLDSSGKPYPERPQEALLRNAARTLWHQNKGTLGGQSAPATQKPKDAPKQAALPSDEDVPF